MLRRREAKPRTPEGHTLWGTGDALALRRGAVKVAAPMARWTVSWLLLIATATAGSYFGTNALVASRGPVATETVALRPLGGLGTPTCTAAARALVAAGDG